MLQRSVSQIYPTSEMVSTVLSGSDGLAEFSVENLRVGGINRGFFYRAVHWRILDCFITFSVS